MAKRRRNAAVTIATVAQTAGVARSTAGFILSGRATQMGIADGTARRVLRVAERLDYVPNDLARSLRRQRTGVVGVLFAHLLHHWADRAMNGMRDVLGPAGYVPFITTHQFDRHWQRRELQTLIARQVEAVVCVPIPDGVGAYRKVMERGLPLVFLNDTLDRMPNISYVAWDTGSAARAAVAHLIAIGRRRIAFLGWNYPRPFVRVRHDAWRQTLRAAGLPARERWTASVSLNESVEMAVKRLVAARDNRGHVPDALFATLDSHGAEAVAVIERCGLRVPEDITVIGMGDHPGSGSPGIGLSTMALPGEEIGRQTAEVVLELIAHPEHAPIHRLIDHVELLCRRTTGGDR